MTDKNENIESEEYSEPAEQAEHAKPSEQPVPPSLPEIKLFVQKENSRELVELQLNTEWKPVLGAGYLLLVKLKNFWKYSGKFVLCDRRIRASWFVSNSKIAEWKQQETGFEQGLPLCRKPWETGSLFRLISSLITRITRMLNSKGFHHHSITPALFTPAIMKVSKNAHSPELRTIHAIEFPEISRKDENSDGETDG